MTRVILDSAPNLRGLCGLVVDGGRIREGEVFRSATLAGLSDADGGALAGLGIRTVYDLRTAGERSDAPDRLPDGVAHVGLDVLADSTMNIAARVGELASDPRALAATLDGGRAVALLEESYRDIVRLPSAIAAYRALFIDVADPDREGAFLFHCTTGKDRTGWAAAALLTALGASRDTIRTDYLATNAELLPSLEPLLARAEAAGVAREVLLPALGVRGEYLDAAFAEVAERFGTFEDYLLRGLGLPDDITERLRARLVDVSA